MKCKKNFFSACISLALSLIVLSIGFADLTNTRSFNQSILDVLDKYGSDFPMSAAQTADIDLLLSRPRPNPISQVTIQYWGVLEDQSDSSIEHIAYVYETPYSASNTLTLHGSDPHWYLEISNRYDDMHVFIVFFRIALVLFVAFICLLGLWLYKIRKTNKDQMKELIS